MKTALLAIDPGYEQTAAVLLAGETVKEFAIVKNESLLEHLRHLPGVSRIVIEEIASYGMPVGREVFQTVRWAAKFEQVLLDRGLSVVYLPRLKVKLALCKSPKANDATIRQAIIDHYGPGRDKAIGVKKTPGPLYGFKADCWAALALGMAWNQIENEKETQK